MQIVQMTVRTAHAINSYCSLISDLLQYFADGYYPGGRQGFSPKFEPSAALVKATLMASADGMQQAAELDGSVVCLSRTFLGVNGCL